MGQAEAIAGQTEPLPDQPADCRKQERAGVQPSDRVDIAMLKYDRAVVRANARVKRCADWFDALKASRELKHGSGR